MLRQDLPPVVIPVERRAEYFKMLVDCDVPAMTAFLRELSEMERTRMDQLQATQDVQHNGEDELEQF